MKTVTQEESLSGLKLGPCWMLIFGYSTIPSPYRNIHFNKPEIHLSSPLVIIKFLMQQESLAVPWEEALGFESQTIIRDRVIFYYLAQTGQQAEQTHDWAGGTSRCIPKLQTSAAAYCSSLPLCT